MSFLFSMHPLDFMGYEKGISLILVISAYLGICVFEGALIGLFAFLFKKYIKNIWLFPILYAIVEFILSLGVFGLTFSNLYLPFYTNLMFIQSAGIFGRYFITALILYINLFLLEGYKNKKYIICAILIFALNMSYGYFSMRTTFSEGPSEKITLVQGNINSNEKWDVNNIYTIMDTYKELTLDAIKKDGSKVFVWPETVVPVAINEDHYIYKTVQNFAKDNDIHIIWGVFMKENGFVSNSIIVFDNEGNQYKERYDKRHLIPFAEYNPFNNNRYIKGKEGTVINTKIGKIGALDCIDSAYSHLVYQTNKNNPDYLVVVSNDSWFSDSFGVYNHNGLGVFAAVESRKYVLRCANTGITSVISPVGETVSKILPQRKGYITYEK